MKKILNYSLLKGHFSVISALLLVTSALLATSALGNQHKGHHEQGPCAPVWQACKKIEKGHDAVMKCVQTVKGGGSVEGVTIPEDALKACQSHVEKPNP